MKLFIVESPGKIKKLKSILGEGFRVEASVGHVRDLPLKRLGVEPPRFVPEYELSERGSSVVSKLKKAVRESSEVYIATDPDREGESIAWHIQKTLGLSEYKRVTFNEVTAAAIKKALENPRKIDVKRVASQEARRVLDRLVGYGVSPLLCNLMGQRVSAGRVQTPALRLINEREEAITAHKTTTHYGVVVAMGEKPFWVAGWVKEKGFTTEDSPYVLDKAIANQVAEVKHVKVMSYKEMTVNQSPPPAFTTSSLQQAASVRFGIDPEMTMKIAQKLYENGYITYHRTDNPNVSVDAISDINSVLVGLGMQPLKERRQFAMPDGAQEGHPAITPVHWSDENIDSPDAQEAQIYQLIRLRALASQAEDARYATQSARLLGDTQVKGLDVFFDAKGRVMIYKGWTSLARSESSDEDSENDDGSAKSSKIPRLNEGDVFQVKHAEVQTKKTIAPSRFTKASLIKLLESEGIGRPSTYASIMSALEKRGYIEMKSKKIHATPLGVAVESHLRGNFRFADVDYTRNLEIMLDNIATGKSQYLETVSMLYEQIVDESKHLGGQAFYQKAKTDLSDYLCPLCQSRLIHRKTATYNFWGCSAYKKDDKKSCRFSVNDKDNQPDFHQ